MDRKQITLKLTIDAIGLPFDIGTFEKRLLLQKTVYLAQAGGMDFGYYYHWYLHGPYCPALTKDAFAVNEELLQGLDESQGWKLGDDCLRRLETVKTLLRTGDVGQKANQLELLASVHFLCVRKQVAADSPKAITATLKLFNKDFRCEDVEGALRELNTRGLLTT